MNKIVTKIDSESEKFRNRVKEYHSTLSHFRSALKVIQKGGKQSAIKQHIERGKLLPRQRIDMLVDPNSPFLELSSFAAYGRYKNEFSSSGIVTGIGYIHQKPVVIIANDASVKGGTYIPETIKKHLRAQEIAFQNNLPCIYLVDSGGIYLPEQANVFPDKDDFGRIFYNQARLSASRIPQISVVLGSCTAGGAYIPAMSDESIIVKNQGTIFLGGPPLVKAATGEEVTAEELGGGEVHAGISGLVDHLADNEEHAFLICRDIIRTLPFSETQPLETTESKEPLYDIEELYGLLPFSVREVVDSYEIIARIVDNSDLHEFKKNYGKTLITGFANIMGFPVGIIANNGILYSESALKGTHFIELCNYRKIPIVFLQNIVGFMVGKKYENAGIAKEGAKMVHAVANSNVPKFTIIFGGSYGAGNYAMSGRAYDPNLLFMYPNSRISVMGGEQAANVLGSIKKEQLEKRGEKLSDEEYESIRKPIREKYEIESSAFYSSSQLWDDGIIDPKDTRSVLAFGIAVSLNRKFPDPKSGIYRM
ncbi:MAG: acyl-CoA carboxylase subunit beta [Bacteroidales bacterium]|nr:acyl-CoA carboxylase subunit beta [Bacteroidales bacterium]